MVGVKRYEWKLSFVFYGFILSFLSHCVGLSSHLVFSQKRKRKKSIQSKRGSHVLIMPKLFEDIDGCVYEIFYLRVGLKSDHALIRFLVKNIYIYIYIYRGYRS
jgi:hypothetical protein